MVQVDLRIWNAVNAAVATPSGQITDAWLNVFDSAGTPIGFYTPKDFPLNIPLGYMISCFCSFKNTAPYDQVMRLTTAIKDPQGITRTSKIYELFYYAGEVTNGPTTAIVVIDKPGTWVIYALLEAEIAW